MSSYRAPFHRSSGRARCGGWRIGLALAVGAAVCCQVSGRAGAQVAAIPTTGQLRVAALRLQFVPDPPPIDPATGNPVANQLPETRFQAQHDAQYFRNVMNRVRSYFQEVSLAKLDLVTTLGPVVAITRYDRDEAYYGNAAAENARLPEMIREAIALSDSSLDFSQFDLIIVFHAGQGQESDLTGQNQNLILSRGLMTAFTADGKTFPGVVVQSAWELPPATGDEFSIVGRTCYGIASVLGSGALRTGAGVGVPSDDSYVGVWDLMDRGWMLGPALPVSSLPDWSTPAHPNPYEKARMGWLTPIALQKNLPNAEIPQVETSGTVYRLWKEGRTASEYFLVENRQRVGFDVRLPESGLLLWHINEAVPAQANAQRLRVRLIQADGRQEIENQVNTGDLGDPFPGQTNVQAISDSTTPSTRDSVGLATGVSITGISRSSQIMRANLYIVPPMILTFKPGSSFSTESVTPTFRATFSDTADPNTILLKVDGVTVVSRENLARYYIPATRELVYRSTQLSFGQHVFTISVQNAGQTVTESTGDVTFRVNFRTIPAGLRMVAVPYRLVAPDNNPGVVFGAGTVRLARWSAIKNGYYFYPENIEASLEPPPDDPSNPSRAITAPPAGLAYWINLTTDSPVRINGDQLEDRAYAVPLFVGWNMVGNPFPFTVDWNGVQVEYQGQTKTLLDAADAGWISPTLYAYRPGGYVWWTAPAGQLQSWEGYWVKAKVAATLRIPPVASGAASRGSDPGPLSARAAGQDGWRLRLAVRVAGGTADTMNFVGVARGARDGADPGDVEKPPAPSSGGVALKVLQGGRSLAQDLRGPEIGTGKTWEFEVTTDRRQEQVTLSWPDLSQVPAELEVRLEDLATGQRIYARTRGGYTYNCGQGGARRFRLTVQPRTTGTLQVTQLALEQARGATAVRFNLSREASVSVELLDPNGNKRVQVGSEQGHAGANVLSMGRASGLTPGVYILQVTATASDGVSVCATRPVVVVR